MPETPGPVSAVERLRRKGDPWNSWEWREGDPDYVAEFGLCPEHIPALVELAAQWVDHFERLESSDWENDPTSYAPMHAWRALGQLRAAEAVQPLLNMQNRLDALGPESYLEEFHDVFGLIGPPAVAALAAYLADRGNLEYPRISAANGLREIGKRYPKARDEVVQILTAQLAKHEPDDDTLNGFLVGYLADLEAVESAETIERAYAADAVDPMICGDWSVIRDELGVPGLGLVPDRPKPPLRFGPPLMFHEPESLDPEQRDRKRQQQRKAKAKRKQQEKARKRNRKRP